MSSKSSKPKPATDTPAAEPAEPGLNPQSGDEIAKQYANSQRELERTAEHCLFRIIAENSAPTIDDLLIFQALLWDQPRIDKERRRCEGVIKFQRRAGTSADRDNATTVHAAARDKLAARRPEIESTLQALQKELRELEAAHLVAEKVCREQTEACRILRSYAPDYLRRANDLNRRATMEEFHRKNIIQDELTQTAAVLQIDIGDRDGQQHAERHLNGSGRRELVTRTEDEKFIYSKVEHSVWAAYIADRQARVPALRAELAELLEQYDARIAQSEKQLDVYLR